MNIVRRLGGWLAALACMPAAAAEPVAQVTALRVDIGFERIGLPAQERMGLLGTSVLFPLGDRWWAGPAVYGAASGQRGGLFVGGAEVQRQWDWPWGWELATGLYAGGGGGAAAPVGGGLMLRGAATLLHDLGPLRAGLSWSHVRFPSGDIRSSQLGLSLSWPLQFRRFDALDSGQRLPLTEPTGLGFQRIAGTAGVYSLRGADRRRIGTVGGRAQWSASPPGGFTGIEAAAAASGGAAGYMEILGFAGWRTTPLVALPWLALQARIALGLGGGGGVPTEGGTIGKWSVGASADWGGGWHSGIELGALNGLGSPLRARTAQLWLAMDLEPQAGAPREATISRNEWSASLQRQVRARRNNGPVAAIDTVGMKLNRFVDDHIYLSAQAHSAYAGGAGAYSIGLIGAGAASRPGTGVRLGAELLVGAAGGGGVASGGGAIAQALAWAGMAVTAESELRLGLGAVKSLRGDLRSAVVELSWTRSLGLGAR